MPSNVSYRYENASLSQAVLESLKVLSELDSPGKWAGGGMNGRYLYIILDDSVDPVSFMEAKANSIGDPVVDVTGLQIDVAMGSLLDDNHVVAADPSETKYIKVSVVADDTTKDLELVAYEKTTGDYGSIPAGKTHIADLKEYSVPASGSDLTEVQSWL